MRLEIDTQYGLIAVVDEPTYTFTSQDNVRSYPRELRLSNDSLTSIHGLELDGHRVLVIGATGGRSAVHAHSAVAIDDKLYLAVGNRVACLAIAPSLELAWSTKVDTATCFGVYWVPERSALITHGELAIARLSLQGDLIWQAAGKDIFCEGFRLLPDYVEAVDFSGGVYRFDYGSGGVVARW